MDDHIDRILELLGGRIDLLLLEDVRPAEDDAACVPASWGEGCVNWDRFRTAMALHVGGQAQVGGGFRRCGSCATVAGWLSDAGKSGQIDVCYEASDRHGD